jgi:transforming growth factor-beta-induced protein
MFRKFTLLMILLITGVALQAQTLYQIISQSPDHTTLKAAVDAAGLNVVLDDENVSLTLFAPDDAAFAALPPGTVEELLEDPQGLLTQILLYHAVEGVAASTDLSDGQTITTLQGQDVTVTINADGVFVNQAEVTAPDVLATNGILHVVNAVLLPSLDPVSVYDIIAESPDHGILEAALIAAGLDAALDDAEAQLTVFAPTDEAFEALPPGTIEALLEDPQGLLTEILLYHVAGGVVNSADLVDGQVITTLLGQDVTVTINGDGVFINNAKVTVADLAADNGVVHVIDAVLIPAAYTSVYDIIAGSPDHNILKAAIDAAGLIAALDDEEAQLTVFAPTDEAFSALPPGTIEALLEDPQGLLTQVLLYHVAGGVVNSTDLVDGQVITTLLGQDVTVTINGDGVFINNAKVTVADLAADNGVVHVIDAVLVPASNNTVYDIIAASPDHTILKTAIDLAGFDVPLSSDELEFTVFAPTDAAFQALPPELVEQLLSDPDRLLAKALRYHVVFGKALSSDLSDGQSITTALGQNITVTINQQGVFINNAQVTVADLEASNGVVHVLDAVLIPALTVYDVIQNSPVHTILGTAIDVAGLDGALQSEGPFTVFAPTDDAFDALPAGVLEALLADPSGLLTKVLTYHAVSGELLSSDIVEQTMLTTLNGQQVEISVDNGDVLINDARVVIANIETFNGVVHVIDAVLVPDLNSVRNSDAAISLKIMPNPTTTEVTVEIPESFLNGPVQATLQTLTGSTIKSWTVNSTQEIFDISSLPAGTYMFTFRNSDQMGRSVLVKK